MSIIESPLPALRFPECDIVSWIFDRNDRPFPDNHTIFVDSETERSYSYSEVSSRVRQFGHGLQTELQWQKGDVLALFAPNSIDTPVIVFGALWAGGILSPANPGYTARELAHQLKDSGAKAVVTEVPLLSKTRAAMRVAGLPSTFPIILLGPSSSSHPTDNILLSVDSLSTLKSTPGPCSRPPTNPKIDTAFLVYSSGTTGPPKGVPLTHYNVTTNLTQLQSGDQENLTWNGTRTSGTIPLPSPGLGDRILACVPFYHILGLTKALHNPLLNGTTTVILTAAPPFSIQRFCYLIQHHRITFSYIVPPIVHQLCTHPAVPQYDLSSIRMTNSGAAPLSKHTIDLCLRRTGVRVKQGYGMTECSPSCFNQRWDDWDGPGLGSNGKLLSGMQAMFCTPYDESSSTFHTPPTTTITTAATPQSSLPDPNPLPSGHPGELWVRGPNVFHHYHNSPLATASSLSLSGWYRTGDIGQLDPHGNLFITGRVKELIKYKGQQVAPAELEALLSTHPAVEGVAVIGVPPPVAAADDAAAAASSRRASGLAAFDSDNPGGANATTTVSGEEIGELPRAYITPRGGLEALSSMTTAGGQDKKREECLAREIATWLAERVAGYKKLRGGVRFVQEIPRNASGKVLRGVLRDEAQKEDKEKEKKKKKKKKKKTNEKQGHRVAKL